MWCEGEVNEWTRSLIPNVPSNDEAIFSKNFYLAQAISGIGCFGAYLTKIGKRMNRLCQCGKEEQSPKHVFVKCELYANDRPTTLNLKDEETKSYLIRIMRTLWNIEKEESRGS